MADTVPTALIAVAGVVLQAAGAFWVGRSNTKDLRQNIDRELGILGKLDSNSAEARKLDRHIRDNIHKLTRRDLMRDFVADSLIATSAFIVSLFTWYGLSILRQHVVLSSWKPIVDGLFWGAILPLAVTGFLILRFYCQAIFMIGVALFAKLWIWVLRWDVRRARAKCERAAQDVDTAKAGLEKLKFEPDVVQRSPYFAEKLREAGQNHEMSTFRFDQADRGLKFSEGLLKKVNTDTSKRFRQIRGRD